jgi:MerR family transcriptional regulator, heat shock protein HspR
MKGDDMTGEFQLSDDTPVYVISVAAQLSGLHPQTLRAYDRLGLVSPGRTAGRGRRYSLRDILNLREVQRLSQEEGVNLSGIKRILELEGEGQRNRVLLAELHAEISQLRNELESTRAVAARLAGLLRSRNQSATLVPVRPDAPVSPGALASAGQPTSQLPRPEGPAPAQSPTGQERAAARPAPAQQLDTTPAAAHQLSARLADQGEKKTVDGG